MPIWPSILNEKHQEDEVPCIVFPQNIVVRLGSAMLHVVTISTTNQAMLWYHASRLTILQSIYCKTVAQASELMAGIGTKIFSSSII